jgi:hypothetical protein
LTTSPNIITLVKMDELQGVGRTHKEMEISQGKKTLEGIP